MTIRKWLNGQKLLLRAVAYAVDVYAETSLDFVDCLLIAYHVLGKEDVFTFGKNLAKRIKIGPAGCEPHRAEERSIL